MVVTKKKLIFNNSDVFNKSRIKETYDPSRCGTVFECIQCGLKDFLFDQDASTLKKVEFTHKCKLLSHKEDV